MKYLPTGNDYVSLPDIGADDGAIHSVNLLHMGLRGLLEFAGDPFARPYLRVGGAEVPIAGLAWERLGHWVPVAAAAPGGVQISLTYLAPVGQRGFALRYTVTAGTEPVEVDWGWVCRWQFTRQVINEGKDLRGEAAIIPSPVWNQGPVLEFSAVAPLVALAPHGEDGTGSCARVTAPGALQMGRQARLGPGAAETFTVYWGAGLEEVGAVTAARELQRTGWDRLLAETAAWLDRHGRHTSDPALNQVLNLNLFFNRFFATGLTLDTEERVCVTSRSPRYYVSAAYWDRDTLLWSLPALSLVDPACAREALDYIFRRQARNFGVHSRYIDGVVLEPGFELDELMAPLLAVEAYVQATGDRQILEEPAVRAGLRHALAQLPARKHPEADLFETFLLPSDDLPVYPYSTYGNVLVWRGLLAAGNLGLDPGGALAALAGRVRQAIMSHCVVPGPAGPMLAWEVDLAGRHRLYDEPPGSLQLLPALGFCGWDNPVYRRTVEWIRSPGNLHFYPGRRFAELGCRHADHPWVLALANSLRIPSLRAGALATLLRAPMDNGIACESIDADSGECATGAAFATCAGYLAAAIWSGAAPPAAGGQASK